MTSVINIIRIHIVITNIDNTFSMMMNINMFVRRGVVIIIIIIIIDILIIVNHIINNNIIIIIIIIRVIIVMKQLRAFRQARW